MAKRRRGGETVTIEYDNDVAKGLINWWWLKG